MAIVFAAIGGLAQIPGLSWLIEEGGNFLEKIGTTLGQFIGGLAGGIAKGFTSSLPEIASDLSSFMTNLQPFIAGASSIDDSVLKGVAALVGAILAITAADVITGIASFLTGGSSFSDFANQLVPFGEAIRDYANVVTGIDNKAVTASANAAKSLSELANNLPNSGGLVSLLAGDNKLSTFAKQLVPFGEGMKAYSDSVAGIKPLAITASSIAAKSLVELANNIPNSGGLVSLVTGDNKLSTFAKQLIPFGEGMKAYSDSVSGINPLAVTASSIAAKSLVELTNNLPNSGGLVSLVTGDNKLSTFAKQLIPFGEGMKSYSDSIAGINPLAITASSIAARSLVELANNLPNAGGLISVFTGESSLASFGHQLVPFGKGMKSYADSIADINPLTVTASSIAARSLVELANDLPNTGGLISMFTGDNSIASFGYQLVPFGKGMKAYADSVADIKPESVTASANAAKTISELATSLPNMGGLVSLFVGENSLASFGYQLAPFGRGMKAYADSVAGIEPESVIASANAAKALSELATNLPNAGGLVSLFTGENSIALFGYQLAPFGRGMKAYADSVAGINPESVTASANAAKSLSELAANLPNAGGLVSLFAGENSIATFGYQLAPFGRGMKAYADSIVGINPEAVTASANAAKTLSELATSLPKVGGLTSLLEGENSIALFGYQLVPFGKGMKAYADSVADIDFSVVSSSISQVMRFKSLIQSLAGLDTSGVDSFKVAVDALGTVDIGKIISIFEGASTALYSAGAKIITSVATGMKSRLGYLLTTSTAMITQLRNTLNGASASFKSTGVILMTQFSLGMSSQKDRVSTSASGVVSSAVNTVNNHYINFYSAGKYLVEGFASGISANTFRAEAQAAAMAEAAKRAAEKALGINSPSKVFYKIGDYTGQGFVNALVDYGKTAYDSASSMADYARKGMTSAIGRIHDLINSDMDSHPTIRPVLDLSDVQSGVAYMNGLLPSSASIGVMSNLNSISSMMNRNNQNGEYGEVVSAIEGLRKDLGNTGDTYIIDGVTYDDGSAVSSAMQTIVRAAKIERRV